MLDVMFDIPSKENITACRITKDAIEKVSPPELSEGTEPRPKKEKPAKSEKPKAAKKPRQSA